MPNTLRIKRGQSASLPNGTVAEPLFTIDTYELYIGKGDGTNQRFQKYIASGSTSQILRGDGSLYTFPLNISSPTNGQVLKYDGTNWINDTVSGGISGSGTTNYISKFTGTSALGDSTIFDNGSGIGIGTTSVTGYDLRISSNVSGGTVAYGISSEGQIQSDVTNQARYFNTSASTQAATFTLGSLYHYFAGQGTFGANSVVSNQYGYFVGSTLTGATNNYAFYSNLAASGTARWNLYINGTAPNTLNGNTIIGLNQGAIGYQSLSVQKNITGNVISWGISSNGTIQSDVTTRAEYYGTSASTQATTFTLSNLHHFRADQGTFGVGSTVTTQNGFTAAATLIGATNNYGFRGLIPSGTNRWNLYLDGTAINYINGALLIGSTTDDGVNKLQVTGNAKINGGLTLQSTSQGFLSPRMTSDQMMAISSPTDGLQIYKTDAFRGEYQYINNEWQPIITGTELLMWNGNQGANALQAPFTSQQNGTGAGIALNTFATAILKTHSSGYTTGTTTTGYAGMYTAQNSGFGAGGTYCFRMIIYTPASLSNVTETYTITIGNGVLPSNGYGQGTFGFSYKYDVNGGDWTAFHTNSGTTADTNVAFAASTKYTLEIEYISSTSLKYYINGLLVSTITSSVPASLNSSYLMGASINKSAGTTARILYIGSMNARKLN